MSAAWLKLARARRSASASRIRSDTINFLEIFVFEMHYEHTASRMIDNQPLFLKLL